MIHCQDERRRQMAEAAEKRLKESDGRGLKDPEGFKRKQLAQQKAAEEDMRQGGGEANLKVRTFFGLTSVSMKLTTACSLHVNVILPTDSSFAVEHVLTDVLMRKRYV